MQTTLTPRKAAEYFESKLEFTCGPHDLQEMIKNNEVTVIDVRFREDYLKGRIPGAINLPKSKWDTLLGLSHDKPNVVYCYDQTCHLAAQACKEFADNGFSVIELEGGFDGWKNHSFDIEK
jgi:rhodanese-related sulfurtransferase